MIQETVQNEIDWHGWKICEEQVKKIQALDYDAIRAFFLNNYERIKKMATKYYWKHYYYKRNNLEINDLINSVYIDIPYLDFRNGMKISSSIIWWSLSNCWLGSYSILKSYGSKLLYGGEYARKDVLLIDREVERYI